MTRFLFKIKASRDFSAVAPERFKRVTQMKRGVGWGVAKNTEIEAWCHFNSTLREVNLSDGTENTGFGIFSIHARGNEMVVC